MSARALSRRLPQSTFGLAALASLTLSVATLALGGMAYHTAHEALEHQLDQRIAAETAAIVAEAGKGGPSAVIAAIARREASPRGDGMGYMLFHRGGWKVAGRLNTPPPPPGWHELLLVNDMDDHPLGAAQALATPYPGGYLLVVAADRHPIDELDRTILITFGIAFGGMLAAGVACAWMLGFAVRRRLERIGGAAEAIIKGDLGHRIARDASPNEFDRLAETLNQMLDRNQALLENLRQVSSDLAHDLRTPLARQKQILDAALVHDMEAAEYRETIRAAASAGEDILQLFAALLRISEIDTHRVRANFRRVDLAEIVEKVVDAFRADAEDSGHAVNATMARGIFVFGDARLLSQLTANLLENALLHTPAGTALTVALALREEGAVLTVADEGAGVPDQDRAKILERFVRLDASRSTRGHGLGLSLVAAIARAHEARVDLEDNAPGLRVRVSVPPSGS